MSTPPKPSRTAKPKRPRRSPTKDEVAGIIYRNPAGLARFLTDRDRIRARSLAGLSRKDQSRLAREVKRARELGLLPYAKPSSGKEERGTRGPRPARGS